MESESKMLEAVQTLFKQGKKDLQEAEASLKDIKALRAEIKKIEAETSVTGGEGNKENTNLTDREPYSTAQQQPSTTIKR